MGYGHMVLYKIQYIGQVQYIINTSNIPLRFCSPIIIIIFLFQFHENRQIIIVFNRLYSKFENRLEQTPVGCQPIHVCYATKCEHIIYIIHINILYIYIPTYRLLLTRHITHLNYIYSNILMNKLQTRVHTPYPNALKV